MKIPDYFVTHFLSTQVLQQTLFYPAIPVSRGKREEFRDACLELKFVPAKGPLFGIRHSY
jgi:hypothetical protein